MKNILIISMMLFSGWLYADSNFDLIVVGSQYGEIPIYLDPETVIESYEGFADKDAEKKCRSTVIRVSDYLVSKLEKDEAGGSVPTLVSAHYLCTDEEI